MLKIATRFLNITTCRLLINVKYVTNTSAKCGLMKLSVCLLKLHIEKKGDVKMKQYSQYRFDLIIKWSDGSKQTVTFYDKDDAQTAKETLFFDYGDKVKNSEIITRKESVIIP